jgi:hypothetical protein
LRPPYPDRASAAAIRRARCRTSICRTPCRCSPMSTATTNAVNSTAGCHCDRRPAQRRPRHGQ